MIKLYLNLLKKPNALFTIIRNLKLEIRVSGRLNNSNTLLISYCVILPSKLPQFRISNFEFLFLTKFSAIIDKISDM